MDLRNELEKLYGPVYSVLSNVVYKQLRKGILTKSEKKLADETFSKEPFMLDSQKEWKDKILNREIRKTEDFDIPIRILKISIMNMKRKKETIQLKSNLAISILCLETFLKKLKKLAFLRLMRRLLLIVNFLTTHICLIRSFTIIGKKKSAFSRLQ